MHLRISLISWTGGSCIISAHIVGASLHHATYILTVNGGDQDDRLQRHACSKRVDKFPPRQRHTGMQAGEAGRQLEVQLLVARARRLSKLECQRMLPVGPRYTVFQNLFGLGDSFGGL